MNKLLSAEFARLFRNSLFKIGLLFSAGLGVLSIMMRWMDVKKNPEVYAKLGIEYSNADGLIFAGGLYIIFAVSVFIGIFVGTEYGDGTIRNKLIVGHRRKNIYLSKLAVCAAASLMMHVLYIVTVFVMGNLLIGGTTMTAKELLLFTAASTTAILAMTAILLLISMSVPSKAVGSIVGLLLTMILLFSALTIRQMLEAPEYHDAYAYIDENTGEVITGEKEKNSRYLTGTKRKVYEFLNDVLPVSQLYQIVINDSSHLASIMGYDCLMIMFTAGAGILIFQKRDLK